MERGLRGPAHLTKCDWRGRRSVHSCSLPPSNRAARSVRSRTVWSELELQPQLDCEGPRFLLGRLVNAERDRDDPVREILANQVNRPTALDCTETHSAVQPNVPGHAQERIPSARLKTCGPEWI